MNPLVGTAGWNLPSSERIHFSPEGSQLARYASVFPVVEINSSFYRPHRISTYEQWRDSVPSTFRFSVKVPTTITHQQRLRNAENLFRDFMTQASGLGDKLGCLLVQLPPSLVFDFGIASIFFRFLRDVTELPVACEPRHASWFETGAQELMLQYRISQVAADPALNSGAAQSGGWTGITYYRLHGSPKRYYSDYSSTYLSDLLHRCQSQPESRPIWCIFDNTAFGAAAKNARELLNALSTNPN